MVKRTYMETTESGEFKVIEMKNGCTVRLLQTPSEAYMERQKIQEDESNAKQAIQDEELRVARLIKQELKEMAIERLQNKGEL